MILKAAGIGGLFFVDKTNKCSYNKDIKHIFERRESVLCGLQKTILMM